MLICHCQSLTDRDIRSLIRQGARTRTAIESECGAGACCGGCATLVAEILEDETREERQVRHSSLPPLVVPQG